MTQRFRSELPAQESCSVLSCSYLQGKEEESLEGQKNKNKVVLLENCFSSALKSEHVHAKKNKKRRCCLNSVTKSTNHDAISVKEKLHYSLKVLGNLEDVMLALNQRGR